MVQFLHLELNYIVLCYVKTFICKYYDFIFYLQKNDIVSIAATPNKKFLVSVDSGEGNALIIWHTRTKY